MREVPCDIGEPQAEFEDAVCSILADPEGRYEVLDRNLSSDPFEPDIVMMDDDEWVFRIVCYYVEEVPCDGMVEIFPKTFGMRKWVRDADDEPTYLVLGVGGTPRTPEMVFFTRFFNFPSKTFDVSSKSEYRINWMRMDFMERVIDEDFERMYSPS